MSEGVGRFKLNTLSAPRGIIDALAFNCTAAALTVPIILRLPVVIFASASKSTPDIAVEEVTPVNACDLPLASNPTSNEKVEDTDGIVKLAMPLKEAKLLATKFAETLVNAGAAALPIKDKELTFASPDTDGFVILP